ncbi:MULTISPECIES: hypothetical protein [unclassified Mesotoga]|uniref:hypothetical protein n=1 Tax=unclassified Mesotoga TaxID=1184398 RepID=UPI0025F977A6|nr:MULTISPECIES: hypothetical protein [unclassified Mesotoga]
MKVKSFLLYIIVTVLFGYVLFTFISASLNNQDTVKGKVLEIVSFEETGGYWGKGLQTLRVKVINGSFSGDEVVVENYFTDNPTMNIRDEMGDLVVLYVVDRRG